MGFARQFVALASRVKVLDARDLAGRDALARKLGAVELTLLGIGASIGAGIFVLTGVAAKEAGPAVSASFGFAALSCVFNALCYSELSSRFPVSGSAYLYTYCTFGEFAAIISGVNLLMDYHVGAASIARALGGYIVQLLKDMGWTHPWVWLDHTDVSGGLSISVIAPVILMALTWILCRGVKESTNVNSVLTITKISIVLLVVFAGWAKVDTSNWAPFAPFGWDQVLATSATVYFSYVGFDAVCNTAEECKNPQRDLPIGIMASLLVVAALYILVCMTVTGMVPYTELHESAPLTAGTVQSHSLTVSQSHSRTVTQSHSHTSHTVTSCLHA